MPELRQNVATKEWVIIATERARRPEDFAHKKTAAHALPPYDSKCPFCAGNEYMTPPETFVIGREKNWRVRVTLNKFPALNPQGEKKHHLDGIRHWMPGVGIHEVIVETPRHDLTTAQLPQDQLAEVICAYRERYFAALRDDRIELVTIFKNHGEAAGTSLEHSHSQLIATPVVPAHIRNIIEEAMSYFDEHGECVFCRIIKDERKLKERIIFETEHFIALSVYAGTAPFHTWILPTRHQASFGEITDEEIQDFSLNLKTILGKLYHGLDNPDYNYVVRSLPGSVRKNDFYHWYLSIIPRITKTAGFEMGSGIYINTMIPEKCAEFLRKVEIPKISS